LILIRSGAEGRLTEHRPYAIKDITLALDLAAQGGVDAAGARTACELLHAASRAGFRAEYWPVVVRMIERA
jgi:3-hydroxyisobutyrate dehydrogenase-like beta-hydroxyacid dehydrogenase